MPNLRDVRHCLLFDFEGNLLNDEEFILLYDLNTSKNPDWQYYPFDLDELCDDECKAEFRFLKSDIYVLKDVLQVPDEVVCYKRLVVDGIEALCVLLKRFAYPIRYSDMCPRFARPVPQFSIITTTMMDIIYSQHSHRLRSFHQAWLSPANLEPLPISSTRLELPTQTVGDLWTGQSDQFVDLELYRGLYTMDKTSPLLASRVFDSGKCFCEINNSFRLLRIGRGV
ncbi:hypothetical protein AWC38_SpisGene19327 [Stylophora pistillata]|uniref:Uncharacterized protein n=1 Tax=Stylophora pistillata TaxID=50429 RepID=A0A2B4RJ58_STYPI|nr:hypothetical protein AWC38_SpisGene19327 [Stylophora pistillata]